MFCKLFGHKYEVSKKITYHVKEYKCCKCNKQLTTSSNGELVELTPKYIEINSILSKIHTKKQAKLRKEELHVAYKMTS
ncbi:DUF1660 family phage protein [Lacinutrix sp. Bg11-31]|uniref:DUF1660 family phage protein n=1 Tax=Lacinutrix sp. Bg11-31 TaxID=2057808 RepID=UPI000C300DB4|nr:DUF1660 family phage protein [Lacinutrix sp. Bg11-31]AUC82772.1 hypothetical protein CW733_11825 [Lacinutrix sp. Bg11-31]